MYPINRCTDSFPHHRNQMPYTHPYYPSFEAIPPQMKVDASRSPVTYGTWPYESHFGHSYFPVGCHGCCNHSYFPGYSGYQPSCSHYLSPPSPFHHHGAPSLPETYPVHYLPPPHYLMDQPRSKYDNNMGRDHHCCGCPNHSCNKIEDRHVKIEEQEPAFGNKSCNSLVPVELKNQPYPVVYLPPDYVKREQRNLAQPELKERDEYPHDTRAHENQKSSERVWNGWFPFDVNDFGLLNHGVDRKGTQNQKNEAKNQFSYPIYLMPYKPQEEEKRDHKKASDCEEGNTGWVSSEKSPFDLKATSHLPSSEEKSGGEVCPKTMKTMDMKYDNQMIIPLEQLEEPEETMMEEEAEAKSRGITMKDKDDSKEKQPPNNGTKRWSSSPPKTSKLPPVCLRVDPLPKRKNCVERSKTTSPHRKVSTQHDMQSSSCTANKTNEVERNEKERKIVEVTESYGGDFKIQGQPEVPLSLPIDTRENVSVDDVRNVKEDKEAGHIEEEKAGGVIKSEDATIISQSADSQSLAGEVKKVKRKNLSEVEAAMIIQSAYRGFDVRRWEPLKKMKQIAEVREHVGEVRSRVEALELSPRNGNDNKQMAVIGETIMSLLLKLDTIQELHPSIRDFRKYVVKQLVSLQEKLDSLATKKSVVSTAKLVEDLPVDTGEYACSQGEQKEAEFGQKKGVGESNNHNNFGSQAMETSDRKLDEKEVCDDPEDKTTAASIGSGVESDQAEAEAVNKLKDGSIDDGQAMMLKTGVEDQEVKLPVEPRPMDAEENVDLANEVTLPSCPDDHVEFPRVSGEVFAVEEPQSNEWIETGEPEVLQGVGVESLLSTNLTSMDGEETYQGQQPLDALKEEQVSVDTVDETEGERGSDIDEETGVKQAELSSKTRGEEFGCIIDHVETSQLELLPVENEIHGAGQKQDSGMNNDYDRSWTEKEVPIKETKECSNMESEIMIEEENAELVEHGHEAEAGTERDKSEGEIFLVSPTVRKGSARSDARSESNWNLLEENEKLRELMEKLIEAGREQLTAISNLSVRVNNLEEKLARKRKVRTRRVRVGSSCVKAPNDSLKGMAHGVAV
ncbi:Cleaved like [Actinidia chinensis var. chinensis]|uniref:Cleaved like n=1 Tax=Actinidia chinensis var. chinensis TaxID=1590841 RepID=A0A2R6Q7V6_ACTCC|nr:Cleaved like [Actinidia chinensis var. chinensis]